MVDALNGVNDPGAVNDFSNSVMVLMKLVTATAQDWTGAGVFFDVIGARIGDADVGVGLDTGRGVGTVVVSCGNGGLGATVGCRVGSDVCVEAVGGRGDDVSGSDVAVGANVSRGCVGGDVGRNVGDGV
jgi:hypothetical protein